MQGPTVLEGGDVCATESPGCLGHPCALNRELWGWEVPPATGVVMEGRWVCLAAPWELDPLGSRVGMAPSVLGGPCKAGLPEASPSEPLETQTTQAGGI